MSNYSSNLNLKLNCTASLFKTASETHLNTTFSIHFSCFVLQVSFQHESYPVPVAGQDGEGSVATGVGVGPGGEQPLSRQVFIVQELEVRDRLASSQINKFLYLYTSESMPRRAHSNMVRQQRGGDGHEHKG